MKITTTLHHHHHYSVRLSSFCSSRATLFCLVSCILCYVLLRSLDYKVTANRAKHKNKLPFFCYFGIFAVSLQAEKQIALIVQWIEQLSPKE